jgi:hypothetical protein
MPSLDTCAALAMALRGWVDEIDVFSVGKKTWKIMDNHGTMMVNKC